MANSDFSMPIGVADVPRASPTPKSPILKIIFRRKNPQKKTEIRINTDKSKFKCNKRATRKSAPNTVYSNTLCQKIIAALGYVFVPPVYTVRVRWRFVFPTFLIRPRQAGEVLRSAYLYVCMFDCLFVFCLSDCPLAYFRNHMSESHQIFWTR